MTKEACGTAMAILVLLFLPAISHGSEEAINIELKPEAEVSDANVSLGDVADISGRDDDVVQMLAEITVCSSPSVGRKRVVLPRDIETRLSRSLINLRHVKIQGAGRVVVSRKSRDITSAELETGVLDYIHKQMPWQKDEVQIEFTRPLPDISLSEGDVDVSVSDQGGSSYIGYKQLSLSISSAGVVKRRLVVGVNIRVFKEVVVSSRQLGRGRIVGPDDVDLQKRELRDTSKAPLCDPSDIVGKRLRTAVPANRVLYQSFVEEAPVIRKNQYVTIRGRKGAICVTTRGRAVEEGTIGDTIQVMNMISRKIVIAKVTSSEIVDIIPNLPN